MKLKKAQLKILRKEFREGVYARDCGCVVCGEKGLDTEYDAHHITNRKEMPADGYVLENGIMLCEDCHIIAEDTYFCRKANYNVDYLPDRLYQYINSSYDIALNACSLLEQKYNKKGTKQ